MESREWLDKLVEGVIGHIRKVDVCNIDADTMTMASGNAVCTVHVLTSRTASFILSRSVDGVGTAGVQFGEPRIEVIDEMSLNTLPPLIAGWIRAQE